MGADRSRTGPGPRRLTIGLGLLTAVGGLVDVGNLVANPQAGLAEGTALVPVIVASGLAVALFSELAGRVTAVSGEAGFEIVSRRLPRPFARANLAASLVLTVMTCVAEVGGLAQLAGTLTGAPGRAFALPAALAVGLVVWGASFHRAETILGLGGLALLVVVASLVAARPHWAALGRGVVSGPHHGTAPFVYLAVAQVGSMLVPYQLVFFSSGATEEGWDARALRVVRVNAWLGYGVGIVVVVALTMLAAATAGHAHTLGGLGQVLRLPRRAGLGAAGEGVMGAGMFVAMAGAALETALGAGYMAAQYRGWSWSMDDPLRRSGRFFAVTLGTLGVAGIVMTVGVDVVTITDYSLVLSTVALPLTYGPIWAAARDGRLMGAHRTGRALDVTGAVLLVLVTAVATSAIPALVLGR